MSTINLTLLHTNDLHGRVARLARIGTLVRQARDEISAKGGYCLYLDAGDSEDSILLESALTQGSAMEAVLRGAGCDQVALGNAIPFRYGIQAIEGLAESFGKSLLCANMFWKDGSRPKGLTPYVIEDFGAFSLGIIGLTAPMDPYRIFKVDVLQPEEVAPALIEQVKAEGADFVMVLSHLGLKSDIRLAEKVEGISVIIGGHSHDRLKMPLAINNTLIVMAGELGEILGRLDLKIDSENFSVNHFFERHVVVTEQTPEYGPALEVMAVEKQRAQRIMDVEVGRLATTCDFSTEFECRAGNLLADALLDHFSGADGAFVMGNHWEEGLPSGVITKGQIFSANRSTGNPGKVLLTGSQLKQFFAAALNPENIHRSMAVLRGQSPGFPHIAGMQVRATGEGSDRWEILLGDRVVKDDDTLTMVTSDLELSEYLDYLVIPDEQVEYDIPTILPEVVEGYLRRHNPLGEVCVGRIKTD